MGRTRLHIADGGSLSQPGGKGTDWRLQAVYDLSQSRFSHVEVTDQQGVQSPLPGAPEAGEVLIDDRGYANAKELLACLDSFGPIRRNSLSGGGGKSWPCATRRANSSI